MLRKLILKTMKVTLNTLMSNLQNIEIYVYLNFKIFKAFIIRGEWWMNKRLGYREIVAQVQESRSLKNDSCISLIAYEEKTFHRHEYLLSSFTPQN